MSTDPPFAAFAVAPCATFDLMLLALECEFRSVDRAEVAEMLDELARPLFDLAAASADEQLLGVARAAWGALPGEGRDPEDWMLGEALRRRSASAPLRAALAVELGRRAGVHARVSSGPDCWAVQIEGEPAVAVDMGDGPGAAGCVGGKLCAHQLAFVVLSGVAGALRDRGDVAGAQRASGLRLLLPLEPGLRQEILREVRAFGVR